MTESESNPGIARVRLTLQASGVPNDAPDPFRSGIHSRGYLPHVKREGSSYFVTFRLADSLPKEVLLDFKRQQAEKLRALTDGKPAAREAIDLEFQRQIERYLDLGAGDCHLQRPEVAQMVAEALLYFHEKQYLLEEWVIMPNHVHLVLWPMPNHTLSDILRSRKRHTARQANLLLGRTGDSFWQHESYDHWIRNDEEKARIRRYIRNNPVKAKLCKSPEEWRWGSACFAKGEEGGLTIRDTADCQSALRPSLR
jgi:REP element-mobilizing transposase RayT